MRCSALSFSTAFSSMIIASSLFILLTFSSLIVFVSVFEVSDLFKRHVDSFRCKNNVFVSIEILNISDRNVLFTVENNGSEVVFLYRSNYSWCSVIISYYDLNGSWHSLLIDDYEVLWIRPIGSRLYFNYVDHPYINPGEEALVNVSIPVSYPTIPPGGIVIVSFATHHGYSALREGVRG